MLHKHTWFVSFAGALLVLAKTFVAPAMAAPKAAALGPEVALSAPRDGYVGRLDVTPLHGPIGTQVTVTGNNLPANQDFQLVWRTVKGGWKVADHEYHGRKYEPVAYEIDRVRSDAAGQFSASFSAPEDFGFSHDIVLQQGDRLFTQVGFSIDMTITISPESGPVGTPITVDVKDMPDDQE